MLVNGWHYGKQKIVSLITDRRTIRILGTAKQSTLGQPPRHLASRGAGFRGCFTALQNSDKCQLSLHWYAVNEAVHLLN